MAPDLVIANAPYTTYPAGVVAIKCDEWMAAARGTLTNGIDALSCTGTYVQDSQQVTTSLHDDIFTAYTEAADTLEIPLSDIPVLDEWDYDIYLSFWIDGEWELGSDADSRVDSSNIRFEEVVAFGFHGAGFFTPDENNPEIASDLIARVPHYGTTLVGNMAFIDKASDVMYIRAFAHPGVTAVVRLDQIILLPVFSPSNLVSSQQAPSQNPDTLPDGGDGGDSNGMFTWVRDNNDWMDFGSGTCDYQRKADGDDAEYLMRNDSSNSDDITVPLGVAHAYGLHCVRYRPEGDIINDDFEDRTVALVIPSGSDEWLTTPEGYSWTVTGSVSGGNGRAGIVGGFGIHEAIAGGGRTTGQILSQLGIPNTFGGGAGGALRVWDQFDLSGTFRFEAVAGWDSDPGPFEDVSAFVLIGLIGLNVGYRLRFDFATAFGTLTAGEWNFYDLQNPGTPIHTESLAGWAVGTTVGYRIEIKRFVLRVKVWDAAGAEPGAWNFDGFKPLDTGPSVEAYPYGPDASDADGFGYDASDSFDFHSDFHLIAQTCDVYWDDIVVHYDPYGDTPTDGHIRVERPEGDTVGEITIPYGAAYIVYWGTQDWTDETGGNEYPTYSVRAWNEVGAPEMQRIETSWFWFRGTEPALLVMNWRSSDRRSASNRVLRGDG